MGSKRPKSRSRTQNELAQGYHYNDSDDAADDTDEHLTTRGKQAQKDKTKSTAAMRAAEPAEIADMESLPIGRVTQVHSLFCNVEHDGKTRLCVIRKTLAKTSQTQLVVGDMVRFRDTPESESVIEQILPRRTILTRSDSFKQLVQHPIVANADQMLIVVSVKNPAVKWGLVDRMIVAARGGGLEPILCLNKIDLLEETTADVVASLEYYATLKIQTLRTSAERGEGLDAVREILKDKITVLAGPSGAGKSRLIGEIQPGLDIRVGEVSQYTAKGRHTTTSARHYPLSFGGAVIDTPGVKVFGLWGVKRENLIDFFPDIAAQSAPPWRTESYERISESLTT
jgi:ribosome biogenesis GTPase / thiamine phosphate phosphatase